MQPSQTSWIHLEFKGLENVPEFKVTATNLPYVNIDDQTDDDYVTGFVFYPSYREHTMLYRDEYLSANEVDFVAIKMHLPQSTISGTCAKNPSSNSTSGTFELLINVDYTWNDVGYSKGHSVTVPIANPPEEDFTLSLPSYYDLPADSSSWVTFTVTAKVRLLGWEAWISDISDLLSITVRTK